MKCSSCDHEIDISEGYTFIKSFHPNVAIEEGFLCNGCLHQTFVFKLLLETKITYEVAGGKREESFEDFLNEIIEKVNKNFEKALQQPSVKKQVKKWEEENEH